MLHRSLDNGIEVAIKESHFSKMVAIQCWVGSGSIHEEADQYGMAHVLEHMLFKGTDKRKVGEISSLVESYGGDINAYTTFDHTVYYLTLSSNHWKKGVELLSDAIFNSAFDAEELKREKEVILEEIKQGNDNPGNLLGRKVFEEIYKDSPAARPIIGYADMVSGYERDDLLRYYKKWYQPNNMKLVIAGDVDTAEAFDYADECFGQAQGEAPSFKANISVHKPEGIPVHLIEGDYTQARVEVAFPGPAQESKDHVDLDVAAFALGAGDSARLTQKLRDELGLASSVGCSLYSPKFGGIFGVSAIPEPDKIEVCVAQLAEQLASLKHNNPVTEQELSRAITNLRADHLYQEETVNGQARSLGFSLNTDHKTQYDVVYEAKVLHASGDSVHNALDTWLDKDSAVIVVVVPKGCKVNADSLRKTFEDSYMQVEASSKNAGATQGISRSARKIYEPKVHEIFPGLKMVYRHNQEPALFNLVAVTEGGLRGDANTPGLQNCMANLLSCATKNMNYNQVIDEVESNGAILAGFSGKDSLGLKLQCFSDHAHHMAKIWRDSLLAPSFPEQQLNITKLEIQDDMRGEKDSPASIAVRRFQEEVFGQHPYRHPIYGTWDSIKDMEHGKLEESFAGFRDQGPWVIGAVGNLEEEETVDLVRSMFDGSNFSGSTRDFGSVSEVAVDTNIIKIDQDKEQSHIVYGGRGLDWADKDRYALDVLSTVLGGSGGRFFLNLRDKESLAYTVTPMLTYGRDKGAFGAYIACAPHKVEQALNSLKREFSDVCSELVSSSEIERAKNYLIGSHEAEMQRGDSQAMTMALMEVYGLGHRDFLTYSDKILSVKPEDLLRVSQRLLNPDKLSTVIVGK